MSNIQTIYRIKTVYLSGIRTRIFGAECEHADQLTTTTALQIYIVYIQTLNNVRC